MIFFGHLGIGETLAPPKRLGLSRAWLLFGCVLPDLLDKPVYYALHVFPGTRSFGHTGAFVLLLWTCGRLRRDPRAAALAAGAATHLLLDFIADWAVAGWPAARVGCAALWPLTGWGFPAFHHRSLAEHAGVWKHPFLIASEAAGALLLARSTLTKKFDILKG